MEVQFFYGKVKKIFSFFALYDSVSGKCPAAVSYTHLTLPTKLEV